MDRISALRNVEDALREYEEGDLALSELEHRVTAVLRTYATEFAPDDAAAYRVASEGRAAGVVVVATSPTAARERVADLYDESVLPIDVERVVNNSR